MPRSRLVELLLQQSKPSLDRGRVAALKRDQLPGEILQLVVESTDLDVLNLLDLSESSTSDTRSRSITEMSSHDELREVAEDSTGWSHSW